MFWAIWAAVGPVSREKSQHTGHCGGKGRQEAATRRAGDPGTQLRLLDRTGCGSQAVKPRAHSCFICNVQSCNGNVWG